MICGVSEILRRKGALIIFVGEGCRWDRHVRQSTWNIR